MGDSGRQLPVILVVEDSAVDARILCEAISRSGERHEVIVAVDGQQALDFLKRQGQFAQRGALPLKSVLLDMCLPKLSGIEVLRYIRSTDEYRDVPVIVISSSQDDEHVMQSHQLGVSAFLRKPLSLQDIQGAVFKGESGIH